MTKTYKQLIEETRQNQFQGIPSLNIPSAGDVSKKAFNFFTKTLVTGALGALTGLGRRAIPAQQSQDQQTMSARDREFRNAATLDQKAQTAQAKMAKFNQQAPLGTQRKQPNIINAPRQDLSGQRTELV